MLLTSAANIYIMMNGGAARNLLGPMGGTKLQNQKFKTDVMKRITAVLPLVLVPAGPAQPSQPTAEASPPQSSHLLPSPWPQHPPTWPSQPA